MANFLPPSLIFAFSAIVAIGNCQLDDAFNALHIAGEVSYSITIKFDPEDATIEKTIQQLKNITERMKKENYEMNNNVLDLYREVSDVFAKDFGLDVQMNIFTDSIDQINKEYKNFDNFINSINSSMEMRVLDDYFKKILKWADIERTLEEIHNMSVGNELKRKNFFHLMGQYIREFKNGVCDNKKLTRAHVWNFYSLIFDMELKGSLMLITAYRHLTRRKIENHKNTIKEAQKNAEGRFLKYIKKTRRALENVPREILACDDGIYIKNQTYVELRGISQGFLIDAVGLDGFRKCEPKKDMGDLCRWDKNPCYSQKCSETGGILRNCQDLAEGRGNSERITVCLAEDPDKRYSWAKLDETHFGNESLCKRIEKNSMITKSHLSMMGYERDDVYQHKVCFCDCQRNKWKPGDIRAISLKWASADHANNRVITDIKLEEVNGIIQLRIQQGRILPGGRIDQSDLSWIKTPNPTPIIRDSGEAPIYSFQKHSYDWLPYHDYKYIQMNLKMDLDDITVPTNYVVVAVRFQNSGNDENEIRLEIAAREFDFVTGTFSSDGEKYSSNYENSRPLLDLGSPGNPVKMNKLSNEISKTHGKVEFRQTDWKKDLGQSIVPFFDLRPVKPKIAAPLSGIGLYHRGCKNCGGFIALKLISYDIPDNLEIDTYSYSVRTES